MSNNNLSDALKMTVEEAKACQKKFEFTADKETVCKEAGKAVAEFTRMVVIPGFRKGKAPLKMIMSKYESEIKEELKRRIYSAAFQKITDDKTLDIVSYGMPAEKSALKLDDEYKFTLTFDMAPDFKLPEYKGIKVDVAPVEVAGKEVNERIDYYRNMYANYADIDVPAAKEDMLKVSYTSDFELPENASPALVRQVKSDNNWLWLNDPEMIPGAVKALIGAEKDKEYTFTAEYPADWRDAELAGKSVKYTVKVLNVQRRKPLNDQELCEKMQVESIDKLNETMKLSLEKELEHKHKSEISAAVFEKLSSQIGDFEMPPSVIEAEIEKELRQIAQSAVKSEADVEAFKKDIASHRKEAEKAALVKLRRSFICRKISQQENITVEQHEVDGQLKGMSRYYGYKEKEFRAMLEKTGGIEEMHLDILNAKVADFLAANAEVNSVKAS
ncbi:MAG: trigger factor [Victivallaceae bacterium]